MPQYILQGNFGGVAGWENLSFDDSLEDVARAHYDHDRNRPGDYRYVRRDESGDLVIEIGSGVDNYTEVYYFEQCAESGWCIAPPHPGNPTHVDCTGTTWRDDDDDSE